MMKVQNFFSDMSYDVKSNHSIYSSLSFSFLVENTMNLAQIGSIDWLNGCFKKVFYEKKPLQSNALNGIIEIG